MKREFLTTKDGSITIHLPEWDEQYHSKHGAINEAVHVFITTGLTYFISENPSVGAIEILEIGFGTGLNALLTLLTAENRKHPIFYTGVEAYPVALTEVAQLNYPKLVGASNEVFQQLHHTPWEIPKEITTHFNLTKQKKSFLQIEDQQQYHLIYFDAFGARVQPELWTEIIFRKMFDALKPGGVLVTYAAKGSVRRAMQAVGFEVARLPGPPGKREMLRAQKGST